MLNHDHILQNIHFTEEAHYCPKAVIFSTIPSDGIPFRFYKSSTMTADVEIVFHDLRLYPEEQVYFQVNYPNSKDCPQYRRVFEDNPHLPVHLVEKKAEPINKLMDEIDRAALMLQIDKALDNNDKNLFMQLTSLLN